MLDEETMADLARSAAPGRDRGAGRVVAAGALLDLAREYTIEGQRVVVRSRVVVFPATVDVGPSNLEVQDDRLVNVTS